MNIKEREEYTSLDNKGKLKAKSTIIKFCIILWGLGIIAFIIFAILNNIPIKIGDVITILFIAAIASKLLMRWLKIKRPFWKHSVTILTISIIFGLYSYYHAYWPIGDEEILTEDFMTSKGSIIVVHREKCKYYRKFFQEKEKFQDFAKGKNTMYCICVNRTDIDLLDSYSNKNQWKVKDEIIDDGMKGYYDISEDYDRFEEWYDKTKRGHNVFFAYDPRKREFHPISNKEIYEEYYKGRE